VWVSGNQHWVITLSTHMSQTISCILAALQFALQVKKYLQIKSIKASFDDNNNKNNNNINNSDTYLIIITMFKEAELIVVHITDIFSK